MNLIDRVKRILLQPKDAWSTIDTEATDVATLYTGYAMILAAIPAVCAFIGLSLIGFGAFGVTMRVPFLAGLVNMVVSYVLSLVGIFVLGLIINALAPTFGGTKSAIQALKVAVYASTPSSGAGCSRAGPARRPCWVGYSACCRRWPCWAWSPRSIRFICSTPGYRC